MCVHGAQVLVEGIAGRRREVVAAAGLVRPQRRVGAFRHVASAATGIKQILQ